jgi:UDP-N-acetylglucosamine--N-acetylmuramyl-(pentapeptide) pyrophosphoryl-undecaprenol N-acetylglucosamine transferase
MALAKPKLVALAAGGTGGHLFPAQALAEVLGARGHDIHLVTDERVQDYGKSFPASQTHIIPSASVSLSKPFKVPGNLFRLYSGVAKAKMLFAQQRPSVVVGFGGYPSLPPLWAATSMRIASIVHEQNAVLGRANKMMAGRVDAIATSFEKVFKLSPRAEAKVVLTGNPVRHLALEFTRAPYPTISAASRLSIVVFGGSQGARFFSDVMPDAVKLLPESIRRRLSIVQQCRVEDLQRVEQLYGQLGVEARLSHFFSNMPQEIADSHLVICRSGASSIAELGVIGRPAILVPLPHAIDNDQQKNAESFAAMGAGHIRPQNTLDPQALADLLQQLLSAPQTLKDAAIAAAQHGKPDAAQKLADLVERHMTRQDTAPTGDSTT